jgi:hypothetical protein
MNGLEDGETTSGQVINGMLDKHWSEMVGWLGFGGEEMAWECLGRNAAHA